MVRITFLFFSPVMMNGNANVGNVNSTGAVSVDAVNGAYGVRPVVSLKSGTIIDSIGTGTVDDPYIVQ